MEHNHGIMHATLPIFPTPLRAPAHTERVLALLRQQGLLRASDLQAIGVPRVVLARMLAAGQLEKRERGLYHLPGAEFSEHESLIMLAAKVPQAVFCLASALQFHELTTQLPRQVWLAMPRGSHCPKIDWPPVKMVQYGDEVYSAGIETHQQGQSTIRVYGVAKTVADCFKHRNKIGPDVALEALREARAQNRASADELWHFAKLCRVANVMRPYLEVIG
jgi:predicted transcriptional regulator of viral defense system